MPSSSPIRKLLLLGFAFIIAVSGIGFGFYFIVKSPQTPPAKNNITAQTIASSTANAANVLARSITSGTPLFADDLSSNTAGRWDTTATCVFKDGTYHVLVPTASTLNFCNLHKPLFGNVAIQVDVSLLSGDEAGVDFRYNRTSGIFYFFEITNQGKFFVGEVGLSKPFLFIQPTKTNAITPGNAKNTLLVITEGSDFKFYINSVFVGEIQDSTLLTGQIGCVMETEASTRSSEASFSHLKVFSVGVNPSATP